MVMEDLTARARAQLEAGPRSAETERRAPVLPGGKTEAGPELVARARAMIRETPKAALPVSGDRAAMFLGTVAPTIDDVSALVDARRRLVAERIAGVAASAWQLAVDHDLMPLHDYLGAVDRFEKLSKDERTRATDPAKAANLPPRPGPGVIGFLKRHKGGLPASFTPDEAGWLAYLRDTAPAIVPELDALHRPSAFPEAGRQRHTLIVARTGHGKSELIKALAYHYAAQPQPREAVVILDPGGDLSRQVARWPELVTTDRLVFVEPGLIPGQVVGINPLDGQGLSERDREYVAGVLAVAIGESATELTFNMETLVRHCANVLLSVPGVDLGDLRNMLRVRDKPKGSAKAHVERDDDDGPARLLALAMSHEDEEVRGFFRHDFDSETYTRTRTFLTGRLTGLFSMGGVRASLIGRPTLRLDEAIEARKFVVVNLQKFGDPTVRATVGRLLVALVAGLGQRRGLLPDDAPRVPVHLIVDEASTMVGPQMLVILNELRKYGIHLTLAQQVGGVGFTSEQRTVMFKNTTTKLIADDDRKDAAALLGVDDASSLPTLRRGQFWVNWDGMPGVRTLTVRSDLADRKHAATDAQWQGFVDRMGGTYYRPEKPAPRAAHSPARGIVTAELNPPSAEPSKPSENAAPSADATPTPPRPRSRTPRKVI